MEVGTMVFSTTFRVRWVDTDLAGVMHFSNFLRYFEACEEEFYRSLGSTWNSIREKYKIMLPRVEAHCHYKTPCRFDDVIEVTLRVREVASKTITYDFRLFRKHDGRLAAEGYIKCIAVDVNWRAVPLPVELAKTLREVTA
jgi:YbgC/YbaW family acyl-CoA thioester hydrolase